MAQQTSMVDNLRPVSRVQHRPTDLVLRGVGGGNIGAAEILRWEMSAFASFTVQVWTGTQIQIVIEGSNDGVNWAAVDVWAVGKHAAPIVNTGNGSAASGGEPTFFAGNKQTRFVRVRSTVVSAVRYNGVTVLLSQTPHQPPRAQWAGHDDTWAYVAASGGITDATAVTIAAANAGTGFKNAVTEIELVNAGATGTEVQLIDAGNSAVFWRHYLPPGGQFMKVFKQPLRAPNANSAINLKLSASSGAQVYANARGLIGLGG